MRNHSFSENHKNYSDDIQKLFYEIADCFNYDLNNQDREIMIKYCINHYKKELRKEKIIQLNKN